MATDKVSFWVAYRNALRTLAPEDGYWFVMALCDYAFDGVDPDFSDRPSLEFAWLLIRDQVAESVEISRRNAEKGRKSGEARRNRKQNEHGSNSVRTGSKSVRTNGMERKGMEWNSGSVPEPDAGFAPAPHGAGSPADRPTPAEYYRSLGANI